MGLAVGFLAVAAQGQPAPAPPGPIERGPESSTSSRSATAGDELARFEFSQVQMGTTFTLTFYAPDAGVANRAQSAAFARIAALDQALSDYRDDSELMQLCRTAGSGQWFAASGDLWEALSRSQALAAESQGAFDITVAPLVRQWRRARRQKQLPSPAALDAARAQVDYRQVELDPVGRRVRLSRPDTRLDLGGIGQGLAADAALKVLVDHGLCRALVDGSGDIALGDPPPGRQGWTVGISRLAAEGHRPACYLRLANAGVSTSGDLYQFLELNGNRYSHIIDPRNGLPLARPSSVTIVAASATEADGLATAICVLGPVAGRVLVDRHEGAEMQFRYQPPGTSATIVETTPGFESLQVAPGSD